MTGIPSGTDLRVKVIADDGDHITIEWDETHPLSVSLGLDQWTPDQWHDAIEAGFTEFLASEADPLND